MACAAAELAEIRVAALRLVVSVAARASARAHGWAIRARRRSVRQPLRHLTAALLEWSTWGADLVSTAEDRLEDVQRAELDEP